MQHMLQHFPGSLREQWPRLGTQTAGGGMREELDGEGTGELEDSSELLGTAEEDASELGMTTLEVEETIEDTELEAGCTNESY